jgi:hypothetical protein
MAEKWRRNIAAGRKESVNAHGDAASYAYSWGKR